MGAVNSVLWQFDEKGRVNMYLAKIKKSEKYGGADALERVPVSKDEVMLEILEITGVQDVSETTFEFNGTDEMKNDGKSEYDGFEVYTDKMELNNVYKAIEKMGYKIESVEVVRIPKNTVSVTDETRVGKFENFLGNLDELDDVQNVWTNVEGY